MTTILGKFLTHEAVSSRVWPDPEEKRENRPGHEEQRKDSEEILWEVVQILNQVKHCGENRSLSGRWARTGMKQLLAEAVGTLPKEEQLVLSLYYCDELNFDEIGEVLGVRRRSASRLFQRAILDLMSETEKQRGE